MAFDPAKDAIETLKLKYYLYGQIVLRIEIALVVIPHILWHVLVVQPLLVAHQKGVKIMGLAAPIAATN